MSDILDYNLLDYDAALETLTNKFLAWTLPQTVCSDLCATDNNYKHQRYGTNLLNANEARAMVGDVFSPHLWQVVQERERFRAEVASLRTQLAKARADVIEEAAKVCDDYARDGRVDKEYACETADELAARIRSLAHGGGA